MVRWAMGMSLLEHRSNEEILEGAMVVPIAMVMRRGRLEWLAQTRQKKRRNRKHPSSCRIEDGKEAP